jgi:hypothetical protein
MLTIGEEVLWLEVVGGGLDGKYLRCRAGGRANSI